MDQKFHPTFTPHNMVTKKRGIFSLFTPCILIAIIIVIIVETRRLIAVEPIWNLIEIVPREGGEKLQYVNEAIYFPTLPKITPQHKFQKHPYLIYDT